MGHELVSEIEGDVLPQAFSTPPKAVREASGMAGVRWSPIIVEVEDGSLDMDGGLGGGAATTRTIIDPSTCNKPDSKDALRGTESVSTTGGKSRSSGHAPMLPTERTVSPLSLTEEISTMMEKDEKETMRLRAIRRKVRSH